MKIHFYKYQATGNDFVLIDNRSGTIALSTDQIKKVCDRRFGVGADGVMLIEKHPTLDFTLQYYNSDGSQSLCGNGSRAAVDFARRLGMVNGKVKFNAFDGAHEAEILPQGDVRLRLNDVGHSKDILSGLYINTGSPHYIRFVEDADSISVVSEGRSIRHNAAFQPGGTNVNFVKPLPGNAIYVRTYERGVEDETLSCGTGVTAAALAASSLGYVSPVRVHTPGGQLSVEFKAASNGISSGSARHEEAFYDIFLTGPAKLVFEGDLEL